MSKLTPIQEAIQECNRLAHDKAQNANALHCLRDMQTKLKSLLPAEKQFIRDVWEAALDEGDSANPSLGEFISQYYPETKLKEESNDRKG